ncbi:hypothetical protein FAI41_04580 [Acetobacteraceae bacterium]|nr:hypothetical protein FAI41_04580 [Acetobacteraceae bacterium]
MSILPLSAFFSDAAGRALSGWAQNAARNRWGLFFNGGTLQLQRQFSNIFGRKAKTFINSFLPDERPILPEASLESVSLSEDFTISTAPKADGNYLSLDKAKIPQTWEANFLCDGHSSPVFSPSELIPDIGGVPALENRQRFLQKLRELVASRKYVKFRIPEGEYIVTVKGYKMTRDPQNIECMRVTLSLQEINPSSVDMNDLLQAPKNLGNVTPQKMDTPL